MLDKSALRQGSSGRQTAGSGSTPCRTDGVRLGLTSQRLKTRSLTKQSITQTVWALLTNLPSCLTQPALLMRVPVYSSTLQSGVCFTFHNWNKSQICCVFCLTDPSLPLPPPSPLLSHLHHPASLPPSPQVAVVGLFWSSGSVGPGRPLSCSTGFVITISLRMTVSGVEAPFHPGLVGKTLAKFPAWVAIISLCLQFTILYLVAWQRRGMFCWSNNMSGIFTL